MSVVSEQTTGDNWKLGFKQFAPFASGDPQCHPIMTNNQIAINVNEMRRQSNRFWQSNVGTFDEACVMSYKIMAAQFDPFDTC